MESVRLGDIVKIIKGKKVEESTNESEKAIRYIQIEDLRNDDNLKYTEDSKAIIVNKEHILIAWDGANAGTIGFNLEGAIGSTISALEINGLYKNNLSSEFLGYYLRCKNYYLRATTTGATIPHISRPALLKLKIPIINIKNQQKIVDALKKLEELMSRRKKQIQSYNDLIESLFLSSIDNSKYELIKINDLILEKPKRLSKDNKSSISYYDISSIDNLKNVIKEEKIITKASDRPGRAKQILEKNDILLSNVRPNLKNIAYFDFNSTCLAIGSTGFTVLRADIKKINPRFLFYSVLTEEFTKKLLINSTGASYPAVKEEIVRNQTIKIPPIELQNKFADYVIKIEEEKKKLRSSLAELETLFDALMQDAFSGNLFKD
ncbi:restriction endonuclease subunit S [Peptoniphilus harei]|uniref:EcoKI restriction-modification system protein HsdS n=1 Tax=Peptoniphilus harei TaxID=54005 RepID=A0A2X1Y0U3_9FIRM|nr:restriction endonuclease subunit S [Peptoniphilus harei]QQT90994.1 restriction endonuclease subunit S [Peptoniphilus harei]SPY48617.1 EcoKI restriction-modification system protein HsdS [Peptoniphilus harei]